MFKNTLVLLVLSVACCMANVCQDEIFRIGRDPENCRNHFMCMLGSRVDFWCDDGDIFDEDRRACRPGNNDSCEFIITPVPEDACVSEFFAILPHPDRFECQRFFVCLNYNLIQFECDPGTIFDVPTLSCVSGSVRTCAQ